MRGALFEVYEIIPVGEGALPEVLDSLQGVFDFIPSGEGLSPSRCEIIYFERVLLV